MEAKSWVFFNVLMQRYRPQDAQVLLNALTPQDRQNSANYAVSSDDPLPAVASPEKKLRQIHYSWLIPIIQQMPDLQRPFVLASMPREVMQGVCRLLQTSPPKVKPSNPVKRYLLKELVARLTPPDLLPVEYLPESTLKPITLLSKEDLVNLIDYLGLRDLAEAVRPIVDKRLLQVIHQCLTPVELQLLRAYMHQKEKLKVAKLALTPWDGKRESLRILYHQRGLIRFAKALSGSPPDLVWHIVHKLDRQRATVIERLWSNEEIPGITKTLIQQIFSVLDFLKRPQHEQ